MNPLFVTYLIYVAVSTALTIWVATTLFRNGKVFLVDVFRGNDALAASVNHLLVVGFYLVNLGIVCLNLKIKFAVGNGSESVEALAWKVGLVLLTLGGMHFTNLIVLSRIRHNAVLCDAPPPLSPEGFLPGTPSPAGGASPCAA